MRRFSYLFPSLAVIVAFVPAAGAAFFFFDDYPGIVHNQAVTLFDPARFANTHVKIPCRALTSALI